MRKRSKCGVEKEGYHNNNNSQIDWELRPGGMLVQKRDTGDASSGLMIKIRAFPEVLDQVIPVFNLGSFSFADGKSEANIYNLILECFVGTSIAVLHKVIKGDLKRVLAIETGLEPKAQRLLYRGKEKDDVECLHIAGVKDMSKIMLLEDPASKEKKLEEMNKNQGILKACEEVAKIRAQVDKLSQKIKDMETTLCNGTKIADKEIVVLTELLMVELLKLDSIEADGEAKVQRRVEVRRIQSFVDTLDNLKARNSNPFSKNSNSVSVATKWQSFESGVGSLHSPTPLKCSTKITQDWELFD